MTNRAVAGLGVCVAVGLMLLSTGCSGKVHSLNGATQFGPQVLESPQPVLMYFYKGGCPTCIALDPTIDKLAREYDGRVKVMKYMMMNPVFIVRAPSLRERYGTWFYPTVILFVDGQERKRWVAGYGINDYRRELDKVAPPPAKRS